MKKSALNKLFFGAGLATLAIFAATDAHAAASDKNMGGSDKGIGAKKGVAESLGNKEFDKAKLPGTLEVGLALGSIAGAVAAIKWL